MSVLVFFSAPVVVATCVATVVALIRKQSPGRAALLAGGICVGLGLAFSVVGALFGSASRSTCDAFCGTAGGAVFVLLFTLYVVVPLGLASAVSTAIVVATIRRWAASRQART